jgi:hypothetical protein
VRGNQGEGDIAISRRELAHKEFGFQQIEKFIKEISPYGIRILPQNWLAKASISCLVHCLETSGRKILMPSRKGRLLRKLRR